MRICNSIFLKNFKKACKYNSVVVFCWDYKIIKYLKPNLFYYKCINYEKDFYFIDKPFLLS